MMGGLAVLAVAVALSTVPPGGSDRRFLFLLPEGFRGWACVDFGVAGAPPLPREGDLLVIRPRSGEVLQTSDETSLMPPLGEALIEADGERHPLPDDVYERKVSSHVDTNKPVGRHCTFFGTEDEADAAVDAPGSGNSEIARGVSRQEREALVALYEATNGTGWTHRVGWLGPPRTECSWHGVECELRAGATTSVTRLDLSENNLVGTVPGAVERLSLLEALYLFGNRLDGKLPEPLFRRWLVGELELSADPSLLTDVSEVDYGWHAGALLCAEHRVLLRADGTAQDWTEKCGGATPDDRTTFCEARVGRVRSGDFARLGVLLEQVGFFQLAAEYTRNWTHGMQERTRVTRGGTTFQVENYATEGPMELWSARRAIEGVAADVEWETATTLPECPRAGGR